MITLSLASFFFAAPNIFDWMMRFVIWGVMLKYSYAALASTSNGNLQPPKINMKTISNDFDIVFKQLGIFLLLGMALVEVNDIAGPHVARLLVVAFTVYIPAMIIMLAVSKSLFAAVYPLAIVPMVSSIGMPYLLMYLFLILILTAPMAIGSLLAPYIPEKCFFFLIVLAQQYYTLIAYHLMGYVMFQYHEEVGYEIIYEGVEHAAPKPSEENESSSELIQNVDMLIKEGDLDKAVEMIQEETEGSITDLKLADRYFQLLKTKQMKPDMLKFGEAYLDLLAKAKRTEKMCEVYLECASVEGEFKPTSSTLFNIGRALTNMGKPEAAVMAYEAFRKRDGDHPLTHNASFFMAKIYNEKLHNPKKASEILQYLIDTFPFHENMVYVKQYLREINAA
jgi:tetratricopeptide (TPR) repeat protein